MKELKKAILSFFGVMSASALLIIAGSKADIGIGKFILIEAGLPITAAVGGILTKRRPAEVFALTLPGVGDFFGGLLIFVSSLLCQMGISNLLLLISDKFANADSGTFVTYVNGASAFTVLFVFAFFPAVCEELLFRGFAITTLKRMIPGDWGIIPFTSALFAAMHFDLYKFIPVFIMGTGLGYIAIKTGSILLTVIFHFTNNALVVISYYLNTEAPASDKGNSITVISIAVGLIIVSAALFLSGAKILKKGKESENEKKN